MRFPRPFRPRPAALAAVLAFLPAARAAESGAVVAADGSGQFNSIQAAVDAAPQLAAPSPPWVIRIKAGVYRERLYVQREKRFLRLVGDTRRIAGHPTIAAAGAAHLPAGLVNRLRHLVGGFAGRTDNLHQTLPSGARRTAK